eukprot:Hpha_TRINITY_DN7081_c0_g1::TRINITY_DN7081_c0_g1_i1::g.22859::m.22859
MHRVNIPEVPQTGTSSSMDPVRPTPGSTATGATPGSMSVSAPPGSNDPRKGGTPGTPVALRPALSSPVAAERFDAEAKRSFALSSPRDTEGQKRKHRYHVQAILPRDAERVFTHIGAVFGIEPPPAVRPEDKSIAWNVRSVEVHSCYLRIIAPCLIVIALCAMTGLLMWLSDVLIPLAMAVFLSALLTPLADLFRKPLLWMSNDPAPWVKLVATVSSVMTLLTASAVIVLVGLILVHTVTEGAGRLQEYYNYLEKYDSLVNGTASGNHTVAAALGVSPDGIVMQILDVPGVQSTLRAMLSSEGLAAIIGDLMGNLSKLLGESAIVFFMMLYIIYSRAVLVSTIEIVRGEELEEGPQQDPEHHPVGFTIWLLMSIEHKSSKYYTQKTVASLLQGLLAGFVYWLCNVPLAGSFAVVHFFFNWVQIAGPVLACIVPLPVALVTCDCVEIPAICLIVPGIIHLVIANVLEPALMEAMMSPVEMIAALVFWFKVWGAPGLLLAVPLTNALKMFVVNNVSEWHPDHVEERKTYNKSEGATSPQQRPSSSLLRKRKSGQYGAVE